jgi:hypothetical protein
VLTACVSTGAAKGSPEALMLQFDEARAELEGLLAAAGQHARDAAAFDEPPPNFSELDALSVRRRDRFVADISVAVSAQIWATAPSHSATCDSVVGL